MTFYSYLHHNLVEYNESNQFTPALLELCHQSLKIVSDIQRENHALSQKSGFIRLSYT